MKDRLYQLLMKLLQFKCIVGVVVPTFLLCFGKIDQTAWWIALAATLTARTFEKKNTPLAQPQKTPTLGVGR